MIDKAKSFVEIIGECSLNELPNLGADSNWKEISVPEKVEIPCQKPDLEQLLEVLIEAEVTFYQVVNTPQAETQQGNPIAATNIEGDISTGKKLIIEGLIHQKVIYVAQKKCQALHAAEFSVPFSTYIVIPGDVPLDAQFYIDVFIEDLFIKKFTARKIFKNVTLFLHAIQV